MSRRSPATLLVHVVWSTHRRRRALSEEFDSQLAAILGHKARTAGCVVLVAGSAPDHVHVLLQLGPAIALADAVQRMKGAATHDINRNAALSTHFAWQAGYWAESLSPEDFDPLACYVREQRHRQDDSHPAERWQLGEPEAEP